MDDYEASTAEIYSSDMPPNPLNAHFGEGNAVNVKHPVAEDVKLDRQTLVDLVQVRDVRIIQKLGGVEGITALLQSSVEQGIKDDDLQELDNRRKLFGSNIYPREPPRSIFFCFMDECKNAYHILLMICGLFTSFLGLKSPKGWHDGVSIIVVVTILLVVKSFVTYRHNCDLILVSKKRRRILQVEVLRGGKRKQLPILDLLVGDIVFLKIGDQVPADGLLLEGHSLHIDLSPLTGEIGSTHVSTKKPFLLCGSNICDGYGQMLVTGVGMSTEWGQLMAGKHAQGAGSNAEETPLQVRVKPGIGVWIAGLCVAVSVFLASLIFPLVSWRFNLKRAFPEDYLERVSQSMGVAVVLMVAAVAKGLPQAVSFCQAVTMKRMMAEDNIFVRRPAACESVGSVTCICSDKTGTLTVLDGMVVTKAWVAGEMMDPAASVQNVNEFLLSLLLEGIAQNSSGSVFIPEGGREPGVTGSPIEKAALQWGLQLGLEYKQVRAQSTVLQVKAFNPIEKKSGVALRVADRGRVHVHWKGDAEVILASSGSILLADNRLKQLSPSDKNDLQGVIESMAAEGLLCLAFSYMQIDEKEIPSTSVEMEEWRIPEEASTLFAIIGIRNPCKPEVPEEVRQCQMAGIKVIMLTGDSLITAMAIATECGIFRNGDIAINGSTFRDYTEEMRVKQLPKITVLARCLPSDKLLLVKILKEQGEVVALVTDDGAVYDAPSLHEVETGTEGAKERSDILTIDGSFALVVRSVQWGQAHLRTVQKNLQYQLEARLTLIVVTSVPALFTGKAPLTVKQLLWDILLIDILGACALVEEESHSESGVVLDNVPIRGELEPLVSNVRWRNILSQCFYQVAVLLVFQFFCPKAVEVKRTFMFITLVLLQLVGLVNARKVEQMNIFQGIQRNRAFLGIVGTSLIVLVLLVEFLNVLASTVKMSWPFWLSSIAIAGFCLPVGCAAKLIFVPKRFTLGHQHHVRNRKQQGTAVSIGRQHRTV